MLTAYLQAALHHATYERLDAGEGFYGCIPELPGVYATGPTLEACRDELASVLEEWVLLGLRMGHAIPPLDGIDLAVREVV